MIVVADTSPINYLILIGHQDILKTIFERVLIPRTVHDELSSPHAPPLVRLWITSPPVWLEVRGLVHHHPEVDPTLDAGERDAISLAIESHSSALIIDEAKGRREAMTHGLQVVGTLGILERAHDTGLLDLRTALGQLQETSFFIAPHLISASLQQRY